MRNSFRKALSGRGLAIDENDRRLVTRFALEEMEIRGYRLVPVKPITEMQKAVRHALDDGKRQSVKWVGSRVKNRWRCVAAIDAAPNWRRGYDYADELPAPDGSYGSPKVVGDGGQKSGAPLCSSRVCDRLSANG